MARARRPRPRKPASSPFLIISEAAGRIRISKNTMRNRAWRRALGVPELRVGNRVLFNRDALDAWMAQQHGGDAA
jgi:excisionase family DNA binding protein